MFLCRENCVVFGAFDERIALVIPQEPGGGGDASWRVSDVIQDTLPEGQKVENLAHAQGVAWSTTIYVSILTTLKNYLMTIMN